MGRVEAGRENRKGDDERKGVRRKGKDEGEREGRRKTGSPAREGGMEHGRVERKGCNKGKGIYRYGREKGGETKEEGSISATTNYSGHVGPTWPHVSDYFKF